MVIAVLFDAKDTYGLAAIFHEMHVHYQGEEAPAKDIIASNIGRWLDSGSDTVVLVAKERDEICGFATLVPQFNGLEVGDYWFMKDIYVSNSARGLGVGKQLMHASAKHVTDVGGSRLDLTVDKSNTGAARFYRSLGSEDVAKDYHRWDAAALVALAGGATA